MDAEPEGFVSKLLLPVVAAIIFVGLVAAARGIRWIYRWVADRLGRWMGRRAARALGWVLVAVITVMLVSGVLLDGIIGIADRTFALQDTTTSDTRGAAGHPAALRWSRFPGGVGHPGFPGPQLHR